MGFWKWLLAERCKYCDSINTRMIDFQDLSDEEQDEFWRVAGDARPKEVYRCEDCEQLTILLKNGRKYWTCPAD